jgi:MarR family transcriptional regulator, organic hydroperoxide resistance regulator
MIRAGVRDVLDCYPAIYFACHRAHVRDEAGVRVLSAQQASVLDHLDAVEPTRLRELAGHVGVTDSSMCLMIDRLERHGYVRRSRDAGDGRCVHLRLTKSGLRIKSQQKVLDPELIEAMLRRLSADERNSALAGLRILARAATEMVLSRRGGPSKAEMRA